MSCCKKRCPYNYCTCTVLTGCKHGFVKDCGCTCPAEPLRPSPEYRLVDGKCMACKVFCDVCAKCCHCRLHCHCEYPAEPEKCCGPEYLRESGFNGHMTYRIYKKGCLKCGVVYRRVEEKAEPPRVSDSVLSRVISKLNLQDGPYSVLAATLLRELQRRRAAE